MGSNISRSRDTQAVLDAIRRIVQELREASRWAEQHVGLTGAQLFVLQNLAEAPPMSVNDLAARTHTDQSSVSTVVTRLVERGLVKRTRSGTDGRSVALSLSPRGSRVAAGAPDLPQERLVRGIDRLPPARRRQLAGALAELVQAMDGVARTPVMFFEESPRRPSRPSRPTAARA